MLKKLFSDIFFFTSNLISELDRTWNSKTRRAAGPLVVVWVSLAEAGAEKAANPAEHEEAREDVDQRRGPERKQVHSFVAVELRAVGVLVVVGLVNGVNPHIT